MSKKNEPKSSPFGGGFWIEIDEEFKEKRKRNFETFLRKLKQKPKAMPKAG